MWIAGIIIYIIVGIFVACNHLASGRCGSAGPVVTFIATVILWPLLQKAR